MRRTWLSLVLFAFLLSFPGSALAILLSPIDFESAGFESIPGTRNFFDFSCSGGTVVCPGFGGDLQGGDSILITGQGVSFSADVVSRVDGNRWEVGLENIQLDTGDATSFLVELFRVDVSASFRVPGSGLTRIVTSSTTPRFGGAGLGLGTGLGIGSFPEIGQTTELIAGEEVTLFGGIEFGAGPDGTFTPCGMSPAGQTPDCVLSLELFRVPEPTIPVLGAVAGFALIAWSRRRRA